MAVSPRRKFHNYPNRVLVESGTYFGEGVEDALRCGFGRVISFEVKPDLAARARTKFFYDSRVQIVEGSTAKWLYDTIREIDEPVTFWLDGHYSLGCTGYDPEHVSPLLEELKQIAKHHIKTHTVLIDDRRLLRKSTNGGMDGLFDVTEEEVLAALKAINPDYVISYEDGHVSKDIVVAHV